MFFLKRTQRPTPEAETVTPTPEQETEPSSSSSSSLNGTAFHKLFAKETLPYSGPDHSYENEAWAPEPYVGLFRKKRAAAEEQLPSTTDAQ